jgi:hypothetical protein
MGRDTIERVRRGEVMPRSRPPFATIPTTILASARVRLLSGTALRVLLWCEASWTPKGKCVGSVRHIGDDLSKEPQAAGAGLRELVAAGLMVLTRKARRPGDMGSEAVAARRGKNKKDMRGEAAVYDIPHRHQGAPLDHRPGDRRLGGSWKCYSADLRRIASTETLSDAAIRTLVCRVLPHSRSKHGELQAPVHLDLSPSAIMATLPDLSRRTAARVAGELADAGLVILVHPGKGRRAAVYAPAGAAIQRIQRGRTKAEPMRPANTDAVVCTRVLPNGTQSGIWPEQTDGKRPISVSVPPAANDAGTVACQMAARKTPVACQMAIQETTTGSVTKPVIEEKAA